MSAVMVLAGVGFLAIAAAGILIALIIGIRKGDQAHLAETPRSQSDAFARRLLVGARYPIESDEGPDQ